MEILAAIWTVTYGVLLIILGLNAVIIVHEFGHFAVARWCGVRCEKFYIWFDFWGLKFFKFKWGETEYGLGLFPLGGYVKMLGQEDNPGAIKAEIERAKLTQAGTETLTPSTETGEHGAPAQDNAIFSPESYLSKTVSQRLAIIVAGVVMNFLFAIVCAAGAYLTGVIESAPTVGNVIPGSPAWEAGLQTGDRITAIDGKPTRAFRDVNMKMVGGAETIQLTIERPYMSSTIDVSPDKEGKAFGDTTVKMVDGTETVQLFVERQNVSMPIDVSPRKRSGDLVPNIGVASLPTLELLPRQVLGRYEQYYAAEALDVLSKVSESNPMRLEKVNGQDVNNYAEYQEAQFKKVGQPITCTFSGIDAEIPAIPMLTIPVRFKMGAVVSVLPDSDAWSQGIKAGDTIVSVDGDTDFDPLKLPQILLRKVNAEQRTVELVIKKANDGKEQTLTLELRPNHILLDLSEFSMRDALGSLPLGLAWNVEPVIAGVEEYESALPEQPIPAIGDRVVSVEFVNCEPLLYKNSFSKETDEGFLIHGVGERVDIPYIFTHLLQRAHLKSEGAGFLRGILESLNLSKPDVKEEKEKILSVRLILESPDEKTKIVDLPILESDDWFQSERGFVLMPELTITKAAGIGEALYRGTGKTIVYTLLVYKSVNSLINGTVSARALNGPVGIVTILYQFAQAGWSEYLMLLCLIGANLAVINLLPIPPLDGGHVLFLVYEGIFSRPPNELVMVILSYFGLFLIILLLVWTVSLDLTCIPRW